MDWWIGGKRGLEIVVVGLLHPAEGKVFDTEQTSKRAGLSAGQKQRAIPGGEARRIGHGGGGHDGRSLDGYGDGEKAMLGWDAYVGKYVRLTLMFSTLCVVKKFLVAIPALSQ